MHMHKHYGALWPVYKKHIHGSTLDPGEIKGCGLSSLRVHNHDVKGVHICCSQPIVYQDYFVQSQNIGRVNQRYLLKVCLASTL